MAVNAPQSEGAARGRGGVYSHITKATCAIAIILPVTGLVLMMLP